MPKDINDKKEKKENKHFFKDFKAELKRVIWPTPKQLVNNTVAVITIVLITAIVVFVLDLAFETVNNYGVNKLREVVGTHNEQSNTNNNNTNNTTNEVENNSNTNNDGNTTSATNNETNNTENTTNTTVNNTQN